MAHLDKFGLMNSLGQLIQALLGGGSGVSISNPRVVINETFFDVEALVDNAAGTLVAPADDTRIVGWAQNLSPHTLYVSHSPSPTPNQVTQIGPGQTYQFGIGWTTAQPLYLANNEVTTTLSRVVVSQGVPA